MLEFACNRICCCTNHLIYPLLSQITYSVHPLVWVASNNLLHLINLTFQNHPWISRWYRWRRISLARSRQFRIRSSGRLRLYRTHQNRSTLDRRSRRRLIDQPGLWHQSQLQWRRWQSNVPLHIVHLFVLSNGRSPTGHWSYRQYGSATEMLISRTVGQSEFPRRRTTANAQSLRQSIASLGHLPIIGCRWFVIVGHGAGIQRGQQQPADSAQVSASSPAKALQEEIPWAHVGGVRLRGERQRWQYGRQRTGRIHFT